VIVISKVERLLFLNWYLSTSHEQRHYEPIEDDVREEYEKLKKELEQTVKLSKAFVKLMKDGIPHDSFSLDCLDGSNKEIKAELKKIWDETK